MPLDDKKDEGPVEVLTFLGLELDSRKGRVWCLCAYREAIVETARCHRWDNVARYARCFRLAAAGKPDVAWDRMDAALLVREVTTPATIAGKASSGPGSRGGQFSHSGAGPGERGNDRGPATALIDRMGAACMGSSVDSRTCVLGVEETIHSQCAHKQTIKGSESEGRQ